MPLGKLSAEAFGKVLEGGAAVCEFACIPIAGDHSIDSIELEPVLSVAPPQKALAVPSPAPWHSGG